MDRRTFLKSAAGAAGLLAMPRLSRGQDAKVLRFVPQADLAILDPVFTTALITRNHAMMVFDALYGFDDSYNPQPQMVDGHIIEDDGRRWVMTLRAGLKWHDGTPVLARDVVASVERWCLKDPFGQTLKNATNELVATSDTVVEFRLKKPFPLLAHALAKGSGICPMMPERLAKTPPSTQITEMVGSGPFKFLASERVVGSRVVYEKFADYIPRSGGTPNFAAGPKIVNVDRVEWRIIPDASTASSALLSGEVDWWEAPLPDLLPLLQASSDVSVEVKDKAGVLGMLRFNHLYPPFDNPAIRRALFGAIKQSDYTTAVMGEERAYWQDNVGFFLPGSPAANDAGMSVMTSPRDLEKVKADLVKAGYKGEKVVMLVPTDFPAINAQSQVGGDMLRRVGINLDYQELDWGSVLQRLGSQEPASKGGWNLFANVAGGINTISPAAHSFIRGNGKSGTYGWAKSEALETLRDEYMDAGTPESRLAACRKLQEACFQEVPYLPTGMWTPPTAFNKNVKGILNGYALFWNLKKDV